eukprot:jgi/Hompol1/7025/HPOL_000290-RA
MSLVTWLDTNACCVEVAEITPLSIPNPVNQLYVCDQYLCSLPFIRLNSAYPRPFVSGSWYRPAD